MKLKAPVAHPLAGRVAAIAQRPAQPAEDRETGWPHAEAPDHERTLEAALRGLRAEQDGREPRAAGLCARARGHGGEEREGDERRQEGRGQAVGHGRHNNVFARRKSRSASGVAGHRAAQARAAPEAGAMAGSPMGTGISQVTVVIDDWSAAAGEASVGSRGPRRVVTHLSQSRCKQVVALSHLPRQAARRAPHPPTRRAGPGEPPGRRRARGGAARRGRPRRHRPRDRRPRRAPARRGSRRARRGARDAGRLPARVRAARDRRTPEPGAPRAVGVPRARSAPRDRPLRVGTARRTST